MIAVSTDMVHVYQITTVVLMCAMRSFGDFIYFHKDGIGEVVDGEAAPRDGQERLVGAFSRSGNLGIAVSFRRSSELSWLQVKPETFGWVCLRPSWARGKIPRGQVRPQKTMHMTG